MTPDRQRTAIAWACGIIKQPNSHTNGVIAATEVSVPLPDYLNDLNAMHEAEKVLTYEQHIDHMEWLGMCDDDCGQKVWAYVHATAAQRAKAFLRTLGLWEETQQAMNNIAKLDEELGL